MLPNSMHWPSSTLWVKLWLFCLSCARSYFVLRTLSCLFIWILILLAICDLGFVLVWKWLWMPKLNSPCLIYSCGILGLVGTAKVLVLFLKSKMDFSTFLGHPVLNLKRIMKCKAVSIKFLVPNDEISVKGISPNERSLIRWGPSLSLEVNLPKDQRHAIDDWRYIWKLFA